MVIAGREGDLTTVLKINTKRNQDIYIIYGESFVLDSFASLLQHLGENLIR